MQTYIVIVSGSILNVSTVHLNGIWHLIWRYLSKPVLGGHPVLSGHYSIPRGCPLNTGFTVLKCTCSRTFFSGFPISSKSNTEISVRLSIRAILFFPPNIVVTSRKSNTSRRKNSHADFAIAQRSPIAKINREEFTLIVASWIIRARWREIRRFVLEFKARYFFLNSHIWCFLFEKSNLRVQRNNTLNLECKDVRDQLLENLDFPIHFL